MPRTRVLNFVLRAFGVLLVLLLAGGAFVWWKLRPRVEAIPDQLADVTPEAAAGRLRVPGRGLPDLVLSDLRGHVAYFVLESRESMEAREGRSLGDALDRWVYPPGDAVRGFSIGEAEGLGLFAWKIDKLADYLRREARLPLYMDYQGTILRGFRLPKGHTGLVVLGARGEVLMRHSGPMDEAKLAELRGLLGAAEPPPPAPAPAFSVGALSNAACAGHACALVFLGARVERKNVPGVEGGWKGSDEAAAARLEEPGARLLAVLHDLKAPPGAMLGLIIGDTDVTLPGWQRTADDAAARAALGIPAGESALVIIDKAGRLAFKETGKVPFYKFGPVAESTRRAAEVRRG